MFRTRAARVRIPQDAPSVQSSEPISTSAQPQNPVVQLQHTIGNRATSQALASGRVQRMPTRERVVGVLGAPHRNVLWVKQSTKYKHVLDQLDHFHTYTQTTPAGSTSGEVMDRMKRVMELYNTIIEACDAYEGETGDKADYFRNLKLQTQNEKTSAIGALAGYASRVSNVSSLVRGRNMLSSILTTSGPDSLQLQDSSFQRNVGGGINQLGVFQHGGKEQYFKANRNEATGPGQELESQLIAAAESGNMPEQQRLFKEQMALVTLNDVANTAGISETDARLANRDVALYRLDQLLGANLIARTQFALRNTPQGPQMGSLMEGAKGTKAGDLAKGGLIGKNSAPQGGINYQDPNLQRLLSRLQLLDTLAFQVDRNQGNFYIQFDRNGNVTGVTGIDNDMSFGTKTDITKRAQEFPGLAKFVDREMAEKIIGLDPGLVTAVMADVLSADELRALNQRLLTLKMALVKMQSQNKLLNPNQWDQLTSKSQVEDIEQGIKQDRTTYYGQLGKEL